MRVKEHIKKYPKKVRIIKPQGEPLLQPHTNLNRFAYVVQGNLGNGLGECLQKLTQDCQNLSEATAQVLEKTEE